jgi:hypothetical protein
MKVSPHDHVTLASYGHSQRSAHRGDQSFSDLIQNPANSVAAPRRQQEGGNRALGFGELGIFGRYGAQSHKMPRPEQQETGPAACAAPAFEQSAPPVSSLPPGTSSHNGHAMAAGTPAALDGEFGRMPANLDPREIALNIVPEAGRTNILSGDPPALDELAAAGGNEMGEARARENPGADSAAGSNVSLQVSEEGGELSVIARSSNPGESYSDMQQLVKKTAAEFGKKLADFRFNGAAEQSFTSALGEPHGSRTR